MWPGWCSSCSAPARLYAPRLQGRRALLLPAGALIYIAIPPARDFASSGLENGLVLAYVGLLWWMLVCWSQAPGTAAGPARARYLTAGLAFVAGLSVLVRPELALVGGGVLVMMVLAAAGWRQWLLIVAAGGALPVAYQIFRMGYYGLLVPQTAIAKDASGAKWAQGLTYLGNFNAPYLLWIPLVLVVLIGILLSVSRIQPAARAVREAGVAHCKAPPPWSSSSSPAVRCRRCTGSARVATSCTAGCC